jgi:hypothetical protein
VDNFGYNEIRTVPEASQMPAGARHVLVLHQDKTPMIQRFLVSWNGAIAALWTSGEATVKHVQVLITSQSEGRDSR